MFVGDITMKNKSFCSKTGQLGPGPPVSEVFKSHKITHTQSGLDNSGRVVSSSERLLSKQQPGNTRRTSRSLAGFETPIPAVKRLQTYALGRTATLIGHKQSLGVRCLTLRRLMSYIYGAPILDVSRSHTTTQHSR